jgi:hypothetical protein
VTLYWGYWIVLWGDLILRVLDCIVRWPYTEGAGLYCEVTLYWGYWIVLWGDLILRVLDCIVRWPYTEGTGLYCDYFIWCVSCTAVVWTCLVMCRWVYVGVFWQLCDCFGNMCTYIYSVLYCLFCVFVWFRLCLFILICFVCTGVTTTATEWKLSWSR